MVHTRSTSTYEGPVLWCSSPQIKRSQLSCLAAVHSGVQVQIKRWLARKHFYFHVEGRFPGISPSCFASVATINVYIIVDFPPGWVQDILITCLTFIFHFELALLLSHKKKKYSETLSMSDGGCSRGTLNFVWISVVWSSQYLHWDTSPHLTLWIFY